MDAKEARKLTDEAQPFPLGKALADYAMRQIEKAAKNGESKVANVFLCVDKHTAADEQEAYAILEQKGFLVTKVGEANTIISW